MKKLLICLTLLVSTLGIYAQIPPGTYGPYQFVVNYDGNGQYLDIPGFQTITLTVITTAFYGIVQSDCFYSYDYFGTRQVSGSFSYQGISNGWYVYGCYGLQLMVSSNGNTIHTTNPYGGFAVYKK